MKKLVALVLALVCALGLVGCGQSTEESTAVGDCPPMVMFNDILYSAASYLENKEDLTVAGKIESCIDFGVPTENNQANDPLVGCEIYTTTSAPDYIFVLYNGAYSSYKATEKSQ